MSLLLCFIAKLFRHPVATHNIYPYPYFECQRSHGKSIKPSEWVCVIRLDSRRWFFQTRESNC